MKIVFDNNVPLYLLPIFPGATTAYRAGWHKLANGKLLNAAEQAGFNLLITLDRGFATQQSMSTRAISVAILRPNDQGRESNVQVAQKLAMMLTEIREGAIVIVD